MNLLDLVLVLLAIAYGVSGFRQGFLVGALGMAGLVGGGVAGAALAPTLLSGFEPSFGVSLAALGIVLVGALLGQTIGATIGAALRDRMSWQPAHALDAGAGAILSVAAMLVVAWMLGAAVAGTHLGDLSRTVRTSQVLATVDRFMPRTAEQALLAFSRVVDPGLFPRYLEPFAPEQIAPAPPPTAAIASDPDVLRAGRSVVRVNGVAATCSRSLEGTGFVYAPERVMTNAHVLAGVTEPKVQTRDGESYDAEVVLYDPKRDVAVLAVPDLPLPPLTFDDADPGDQGAVLGYPGNGPFAIAPARVRAEQRLQGPDIYGQRQVVRNVLSLYAHVRPGNSGGPLVSPEGTVTGVVFAASVEDPRTGYALTVDEVQGVAQGGMNASRPVSTGACT